MISPSDRSPPIQTSPCACLWFDCDGMRAKWGNIMPIMQVIPLCDLWHQSLQYFVMESPLHCINCIPKDLAKTNRTLAFGRTWCLHESFAQWASRLDDRWDVVGHSGTWKAPIFLFFFRFLPISVNYLCQFLKSHFCDLLCHFSLVFWCYRERGRDFLMYSFWGWKEGWECIEWLAGFGAWAPQRGTASHRMSLCKSSTNLSQSMVVSLVDGISDLVVLLAVWCCLSTNAWKVQSLPQVEPGDEANLHETRPLTFLEDSFLFHTAMI